MPLRTRRPRPGRLAERLRTGWTLTELDTVVTWVDARERLPRTGFPVAAAITGRYPADGVSGSDDASGPGTELGEEFWLVRPMYFTDRHRSADGTEHRDCFVDSDGVVRLPHGRAGSETVTHWAELPALPGRKTHILLGEDVPPALRNAWGAHPLG